MGRTLDEVYGTEGGQMAEILLGAVSAMVVLAGVSVYSALRLAKRTDEMVSVVEIESEKDTAPMLVRFPESMFCQRPRPERAPREAKPGA